MVWRKGQPPLRHHSLTVVGRVSKAHQPLPMLLASSITCASLAPGATHTNKTYGVRLSPIDSFGHAQARHTWACDCYPLACCISLM